MIGIYKITNPKGKVYIGQSISVNKRKDKYYKHNCFGSQRKLKSSVDKYGIENHLFQILEVCLESELNAKERYWQDFYDSVNNGLNCRLTTTDTKSGYLSEETKERMSKAAKGKKKSPMKESTRLKIVEGLKNRPVSKKTRNKIANSVSKPVLLLDLQGLIIKEFTSVKTAAKYFGITSSVICNNVKGLSKTTKQGTWKMK